ncbi:MAG: DUF6734 family protein [Terracidiphilus sp.]
MRAVWSFWSKPYEGHKGRVWREPKHHLLAWGLSLRLAREHFPETMLVTDSEGKALLVDRLGLEFTEVSTELDRLRDVDPGWWALGKLMAYSLQDRPFVHLDTDVFLWRPLPQALASAPVFAQCPERFVFGDGRREPRQIEALFRRHGLSLPAEWEWACSLETNSFREESCGIVGGNRFDFLRHYADTAIGMITDPAHAAPWSELPHKDGFNQLMEQFWLAACVDYHRHHPQSPFRGITIRYLFPTLDAAFNPQAAAQAGFTHLLGDTKSHPEVITRLERRVAEIDPAFLRHCTRVAAHPGGLEA